jgi:DNA repair protein RecN (Recombination protein N)
VLSELRVRDLGVIEDLTLHLGPGMTALTGETGAGKTLVVEALQLVLGGRAAAGLVRSGADEALVEARFVVPGLDGAAGTGDEGVEVVLARAVPSAGRSRAWLDGRMVPVTALVEAGRELVDIHGQHEHQSLLAPAAQRHALDRFAGSDLGPRQAARARLEAIDRQLASLGGDAHQRAREADVLRHQCDEIVAARIEDVDEDEHLALEEERLAELSAHRAEAAAALEVLEGGADDGGVVAQLGQAAAALGGRTAFAPWSERLRAAQAELADVGSDLRGVVETWEDDPARLAEVQERRRLLGDLRRKYGSTLSEVAAFGVTATDRLQELEGAAATASALEEERVDARAALGAAEAELGRVRRAAAPALAAAVQARLGSLAMASARFEVGVDPEGAGDGVRFGLGANPGEPVQPLAKVASGGELARAMLAVQLETSGGPDTMVFDEVDAGVGGTAALALAGALREVSLGHQVLVVTHLAQVAAFADRQISVEKAAKGDRTVTTATERTGSDRVVELSRMLSGSPDSATARAHAEELLGSARQPVASTTTRRRGE